jgi:hypothetical protein
VHTQPPVDPFATLESLPVIEDKPLPAAPGSDEPETTSQNNHSDERCSKARAQSNAAWLSRVFPRSKAYRKWVRTNSPKGYRISWDGEGYLLDRDDGVERLED